MKLLQKWKTVLLALRVARHTQRDPDEIFDEILRTNESLEHEERRLGMQLDTLEEDIEDLRIYKIY